MSSVNQFNSGLGGNLASAARRRLNISNPASATSHNPPQERRTVTTMRELTDEQRQEIKEAVSNSEIRGMDYAC